MSEQKYVKEEMELFNAIDDELGEVTELVISRSGTDLILKYKSNGKEEINTDSHLSGKTLIKCIVYCSKRFCHGKS